jgi:asparagine synthase (glutamine-hydrolysing)
MCGICGAIQIVGTPRLPLPPHVLDRMTDAMTHRGPNDRGTRLAPGAALGVRRLSIVDVEGGHQPFADEQDRIWAIQNGELYNHETLRRELASDGHSFRSRCDTEVLPHLYEREGVGFVERLRGKFGVAVWDEKRRRAVIARDRLGIKPIYYAQAGDVLLFASELKSLLASGLVDDELDYKAIDAYLTLGFFPAPRTPLAKVRKLLPGERLIVDSGTYRTERYWSFPHPTPDSERSEDEWATALLEELEESVRLRLMSDVPLGAMLSGGLDSSLIVALMARNISDPVKTFSVGFSEAGSSNELADARDVASLFGTEHHELELSFARQDVDLADLVWHLDEPLADLSSLGFLALSKLAAETVTVALSGQGADELLGGYSRHRNANLARVAGSLSRPIGVLARPSARLRHLSGVMAARGPVERYLAANANTSESLRARLAVGPLTAVEGSASAAIGSRLDGVEADPLATMLFLDGQLGLADDMLHYFDRASMAHSLEVRVPFLDHHVVELCAAIPSSLKVRGVTTKYLLKRAARGILPDRIVDKKKIGFFNAAVAQWFKAQSSTSIPEYLLSPGARYTEMLDRPEVERLIARQAAGDGRSESNVLLSILMLEIWLSSFLPRAFAEPGRVEAVA